MPIIIPVNICDVCRLLDNDLEPKEGFYCNLCDSWICVKDQDKWIRRAKAAIKRKLEPTYSGDPNYKTGTEE